MTRKMLVAHIAIVAAAAVLLGIYALRTEADDKFKLPRAWDIAFVAGSLVAFVLAVVANTMLWRTRWFWGWAGPWAFDFWCVAAIFASIVAAKTLLQGAASMLGFAVFPSIIILVGIIMLERCPITNIPDK